MCFQRAERCSIRDGGIECNPTVAALRSSEKSATLVFLFDSKFGRGLTSGTLMRGESKRRLQFTVALRLVMALFLFCWCTVPSHATFPHRDPIHKVIEGLESQWREAQLTDNVATLDRLLADDYLGISANGTLETKADVLALRRSGQLKITQLDLSDVKIRVYGDTAVVTSKVDLTGKNGDRDISGHYRYTRVYNYRNGQWRIVSFEASRAGSSSQHAEKH
jgi:ketosteroid isomerase-like protein